MLSIFQEKLMVTIAYTNFAHYCLVAEKEIFGVKSIKKAELLPQRIHYFMNH